MSTKTAQGKEQERTSETDLFERTERTLIEEGLIEPIDEAPDILDPIVAQGEREQEEQDRKDQWLRECAIRILDAVEREGSLVDREIRRKVGVYGRPKARSVRSLLRHGAIQPDSSVPSCRRDARYVLGPGAAGFRHAIKNGLPIAE